MIVQRRSFLTAFTAFLTAPAIVRATNLMPVSTLALDEALFEPKGIAVWPGAAENIWSGGSLFLVTNYGNEVAFVDISDALAMPENSGRQRNGLRIVRTLAP